MTIIRHPLTDAVVTAGRQGAVLGVSRLLVGSCAQAEIDRLKSGGFRSDSRLAAIGARITSYLDGKGTDLLSLPIDIGEGTAFRAAVLAAARTIPYGTVLSYTELAAKAGYPGAVRAAASVMRRNSLPLLIPCHRVVRKDGAAGGYCGSQSGDDVVLKQRLLQLEQRQTQTGS
jgi:AraC family transcriptional regulator of adaptative response/methylated-DNA-[protein]-cysteine methyltransferase